MPIELQIIKYIIKKNIRFSFLYIEEMRNVSKWNENERRERDLIGPFDILSLRFDFILDYIEKTE